MGLLGLFVSTMGVIWEQKVSKQNGRVGRHTQQGSFSDPAVGRHIHQRRVLWTLTIVAIPKAAQ